MTIGWVKQKEATFKDKQSVKWMEMTIRAPGGSFSLTLSKIKEKSQENSPDYNLFFSPNRRGENYDRMKAGSLWMKTSEKGNPYLSGYIESPFVTEGKMYISVVKYTAFEGMPVQDILYNVLWSPEEKKKSYDDGYESAYSPAPAPTPMQPPGTVTTTQGVPVTIEITEDEIPF